MIPSKWWDKLNSLFPVFPVWRGTGAEDRVLIALKSNDTYAERILAASKQHSAEEDASKTLCREILKVKDFSQVKRQLSPDDRKAYAAAASLVHNSQPFLDIINEIQYDQLVFMGLQSENDRQLMIGRGTINGADLIETRMRELDAEHQQNIRDAQPADGSQTYEPINKLDT